MSEITNLTKNRSFYNFSCAGKGQNSPAVWWHRSDLQMTNYHFLGAVIVFTGLLSMFFLRRRLQIYRWIGIVFVISGLAIVGLCDILNQSKSSSERLMSSNGSTSEPMFFSDEYFGVHNIGPLKVRTSQF